MANAQAAASTCRNAVLSRVAADDLQRLAPRRVELEVNEVLYEPNHEIEYAYFPESGVISVVALMENGSIIEVGTIGREGMACPTPLLEAATAPFRYFVQVAGTGHRVGAGALATAAAASPALRQTILRSESVFRHADNAGHGLQRVAQCRAAMLPLALDDARSC